MNEEHVQLKTIVFDFGSSLLLLLLFLYNTHSHMADLQLDLYKCTKLILIVYIYIFSYTLVCPPHSSTQPSNFKGFPNLVFPVRDGHRYWKKRTPI